GDPQLPAGRRLPATGVAERRAGPAVPHRRDRRRRRGGRGPGPGHRRPPHRAAAGHRRELAGLPRPRRPPVLPLLGLTAGTPAGGPAPRLVLASVTRGCGAERRRKGGTLA